MSEHPRHSLTTARMQQLATVLELVRLGHGVSLVPKMAAVADTSPGRVYRKLSGPPPTRTLAMAWNRMRYKTKVFHRFAGVLRGAAPSGGPEDRGPP